MPIRKRPKRCAYGECKKPRRRSQRHCATHEHKATVNAFLGRLYSRMYRRTKGKDTNRPHLYKGKAVLPREVFYVWAKNHPDLLSLYKQWAMNDFDQRLTPSINRIRPEKGYTLDNIEWMTFSQNAGLSGTVRKLNQKKAIYTLLGVNSNVKRG